MRRRWPVSTRGGDNDRVAAPGIGVICEFTLKLDEDYRMFRSGSAESSPLRMLALAVLACAVHDAQTNTQFIRSTRIAGLNAFEWLHNWRLVEPWCRAAEISPGRLKQRIELLSR